MFNLPLCLAATLSLVFAHVSMADSLQPLSLQEATSLAAQRGDPSISSLMSRADSLREAARADGQLPDPKIKFGVANMATDSFALSQEPMAQIQFGLHQSLPSKTRRNLVKAKGTAHSRATELMAISRQLAIALEVKRHWLRIKSAQTALTIIVKKKAAMSKMMMALGASYETGNAQVQQMLTLEAELALLDDKTEVIEQYAAEARVGLARFIGWENSMRPIIGNYSDLRVPLPLIALETNLNDHPEIRSAEAMVKAGDTSVALAKENYKPTWGLDVGYGHRSGGRADLATAMVTLDVPIFTSKRQDKRLSAARKQKQAALMDKRAHEMDMLRRVRALFVVWQKTSKRIMLYEDVLLKRSQAVSQASEDGYSNGTIEFNEIIRSQISELDLLLNLEAIRLERAEAQIDLIYFQGEGS